jgi:hypothetical protein
LSLATLGVLLRAASTMAGEVADDPVARCQATEDLACLERMGMFDEAIAVLDHQAQTATPSAARALHRSLRWRLALGRTERVADLLSAFAARFPGHALSDEIAESAFFLGEVLLEHGKLNEAVSAFRRYLAVWARWGSKERELAAHVRLAELLLRQSCPEDNLLGACVRLSYVQGRCSEETFAYVEYRGDGWWSKQDVERASARLRFARATLVKRAPAMEREARRHLQAALRLWKEMETATPSAATRDFVAHAQLLAAYPHVELAFLQNDGAVHDSQWEARSPQTSLAHLEALQRVWQEADKLASARGRNEVAVHAIVWNHLFYLPRRDHGAEREFCGMWISHPIEDPARLDCPMERLSPDWNQWNELCEHMASGALSEILPFGRLPSPALHPTWSPPWGQLDTGVKRYAPFWHKRRAKLRKPSLMVFLEDLFAYGELPFAWEFRHGFPLPPPYPPVPDPPLP